MSVHKTKPRTDLHNIYAPSSLAANVVYRFKCSHDANISYIGKTERHLLTRMAEHLNPNFQDKSAVTKHISQCVHCQANVGHDNFKSKNIGNKKKFAQIGQCILKISQKTVSGPRWGALGAPYHALAPANEVPHDYE